MPNANLKLLNALTTIVIAYGGNGKTVRVQHLAVLAEGGVATERELINQSTFVDGVP